MSSGILNPIDAEVTVTKRPDGYVSVYVAIANTTFLMEVGKTKYSGYLNGIADKPIFLEGEWEEERDD